ncbi:hypothetical protein KRX53_03570 [Dermabacteraceae bacterium TAE3-ERU5]|nr:hypothetical protein [Dermabacteraceae bacterium TAE3-ERU5]
MSYKYEKTTSSSKDILIFVALLSPILLFLPKDKISQITDSTNLANISDLNIFPYIYLLYDTLRYAGVFSIFATFAILPVAAAGLHPNSTGFITFFRRTRFLLTIVVVCVGLSTFLTSLVFVVSTLLKDCDPPSLILSLSQNCPKSTPEWMGYKKENAPSFALTLFSILQFSLIYYARKALNDYLDNRVTGSIDEINRRVSKTEARLSLLRSQLKIIQPISAHKKIMSALPETLNLMHQDLVALSHLLNSLDWRSGYSMRAINLIRKLIRLALRLLVYITQSALFLFISMLVIHLTLEGIEASDKEIRSLSISIFQLAVTVVLLVIELNMLVHLIYHVLPATTTPRIYWTIELIALILYAAYDFYITLLLPLEMQSFWVTVRIFLALLLPPALFYILSRIKLCNSINSIKLSVASPPRYLHPELRETFARNFHSLKDEARKDRKEMLRIRNSIEICYSDWGTPTFKKEYSENT